MNNSACRYHKTILVTAIAAALGGVSASARASITNGTTLSFDAGMPFLTGCTSGNFTGTSCTLGGSPYTAFEITDMGGSYITMDLGNGAADKIAISQFAPLSIGSVQLSSGQHSGEVDGSESPAIDNPWNFFRNTHMHTLTSPISVLSDTGATKTLDFSGWGLNGGKLWTWRIWTHHSPGRHCNHCL